MTANMNERLSRIISRVVELKSELDRIRGWGAEHKLGSPATMADIKAIEELAGFSLPEDYKSFLKMHNGWIGLRGQNDLLSTQQLQSEPVVAAISKLKALQVENGDPAAGGFVIDASLGDTDIAYFDPASRHAKGAIDVVRWDAYAGEYARYHSFVDYLRGIAESLERRIVSEASSLR